MLIKLAVAIAIIALIMLSQSVYVIREGQQGVVTQFGEPVRVVREPGLYAKLPFVQSLAQFDQRVLSRDIVPGEYLTLDRKRMVMDQVTRWQIADPLQFFRTVRDEDRAVARLDDITSARLRQEIAKYEFVPIVRERRDDIMAAVTGGVREAMRPFGIAVVDVTIKRLDLPSEVQDSVFARMEAERHRIAERFRAEGEERAREIRATADKERDILLATAYATSQALRGEGDAQAIEVTGQAFSEDPDFYAFLRRLESYEKILNERTTIVLSPDSPLLRFLEGPNGRQP